MHNLQGQSHYDDELPSKVKRIGVIVLTDNRQPSSTQTNLHKDFRSSAFKQTEVDPLQFPKNDFASIHDLDLIAELNRRVADLQHRVEALKMVEVEEIAKGSHQIRQKKKNRRKFKELVRDHVCLECQKKYGSETALKNHIKIKHRGEDEEEPIEQ